MYISYNSENLQEICNKSSSAIDALGEERALFLQARLADIQASDTVFDLPLGERSITNNDCTLKYKNSFSIRLTPNYGPLGAGQAYDWTTVRRVKIMGVNNVA